MDKLPHLTTDEIILFMDRELDKAATSSAEQHLLQCIECGKRLTALQRGSSAYAHYQETVLKPGLGVPVSGWGSLSYRHTTQKPKRWGPWWAAAAAAATLALVWFYFPLRSEPDALRVLEKAAAVPETPRGEILFRANRYRFARPAVLESGPSETRFQHVQTLFVQAGYSWRDPLSARSFVNWRQHLSDKQDSITAIHEEGGHQFYRVRTRTDASSLHSASVTLEATTYHATNASFEFQGEDPIEVSEHSDPPVNRVQEPPAIAPPSHPKVTESIAGPEDELRVFAALDAIGADAEEPIDVKLDAGQHAVLVTGFGIPPGRGKQIEAALANLPNTIVRFRSSAPLENSSEVAIDADNHPSAATSPSRKRLEDFAGGVRQLQTITDESMETSNALFAQSHLLLVLAQEFPPPIEAALNTASVNTLLALRQRHLGAMSYALRHLRDQLKPLLAEDVPVTETADTSWQNTAGNLYQATRNLDRLVSRLLAGSYDERDGELMRKELPNNLSQVEMLIRADSR